MDGAILIRLLLAHILTDFVFQPDNWVEKKNKYGIRGRYFWFHILIAGATTFILLWGIIGVWAAVIIMVTHAIIDYWKIVQVRKQGESSSRKLFFWDQLLHLLIFLFLWLLLTDGFYDVIQVLENILNNGSVLAVITAFIFITQPAGVIIGKITDPLSREISSDDSLKRAGMYIGVTERILVFIFVLLGQYSVIGFLIAGKSILRITKDGEENARKKTEYVLIGTLISFIVAVLTGLLVKTIIP
ncbi:MAG: DUF3307 domain-containing protein [Chlorobi bacterium]|nr:DUF3307 domain-containing protein [Chlorobiota bacterium]